SAARVRGKVAAASRAGTITLTLGIAATVGGRAEAVLGLRISGPDLLGCAPVRIALTHAFCWPEVRRGAERFVPELAAALHRRGHEVVHYSSAWEAGTAFERGVTTVRLRRR